ncbi:MAG TPA: hypothetical protein VHB25_05560 [Gemmatimonadaceae bacterium]|nr:hypothetical protein [Gemmatimonadaceae bacterium]
MLIRALRSIVLLVALGACVPTIAHGPVVEPGASTGASLSLPYVSDNSGYLHQPFAVGPFGLNAAYAWRDSESGPALRVGAAWNVFPPRFEPDVYVELPRAIADGMDAGLGIAGGTILSPAALPYAQLGRIRRGSGPYVTAGYLHEIGRDSLPSRADSYHDNGWLATLAYQQASGAVVRHYFVTGVLGQRVAHDCSMSGTAPQTVCADSRPWGVFAGVTLERMRHRGP